jgi:hypothetical protein
LSPLYGVDKDLLHQVLRQEQAKLEKRLRRTRWFMIVVTAFLFINAALFLAIMIDPNQPPTFSARFIVWDYVVGGVGVAAALTVAGALLTARRSRQAREQGFGDSLRDHLRRRIAQLDNAATGERRLALIIVAATLICATAISIGHLNRGTPDQARARALERDRLAVALFDRPGFRVPLLVVLPVDPPRAAQRVA